jgi:hypothetical protein
MEEGEFPDEPQLMNGQSHRAHLHFDMRSKEGSVVFSLLYSVIVLIRTRIRLVSRPARPVAPSHQMPAGRKHHLDPALDPAKFTSGRPKQAVLAPGLSRPLAGNVQGGTCTWVNNSRSTLTTLSSTQGPDLIVPKG